MSHIGMKIRIIDAKKFGMGNPRPDEIGKFGEIIGHEILEGTDLRTPRIRLADGTLLRGTECWWEPVND